MIRITEEQFGDLKRRENPEVFTEEQISNWILDASEKLQKADLGEADAIEKAEVEEFNEEFKLFTKIQVIKAPKAEDLNKSLTYETLYIRERQIEWTEEIQKGEDGEPLKGENDEIIKARSGIYADTAYNRKKGRVGQRYGSKKSTDEGESKGESDVYVGEGTPYKTKKSNIPEKLSDVKSVLMAKSWFENKYGKGWKGSQLTDSEIDKFQELKIKEKKGFSNYK